MTHCNVGGVWTSATELARADRAQHGAPGPVYSARLLLQRLSPNGADGKRLARAMRARDLDTVRAVIAAHRALCRIPVTRYHAQAEPMVRPRVWGGGWRSMARGSTRVVEAPSTLASASP
jgi:hypothetical protein